MLNAFPWIQSPAAIVSIVMVLIGALLLIGGLIALFKLRARACVVRSMLGLVFALAGGLIGMVSVGTYGYIALTSEDPVATIEVRPSGPQRFDARFIYRDGRTETFGLAGDELYVDARVLKWQPLATLLGLRTMFELDRIAGRYRSIEDERSHARTIFPLGAAKPFDLFVLRRRVATLSRLVDAEYGSAAFVPANRAVELELSVSASGLILREKPRN